MKIIIAGSRDITEYHYVVEAMKRAIEYGYVPSEIVSGCASGVDSLGGIVGCRK